MSPCVSGEENLWTVKGKLPPALIYLPVVIYVEIIEIYRTYRSHNITNLGYVIWDMFIRLLELHFNRPQILLFWYARWQEHILMSLPLEVTVPLNIKGINPQSLVAEIPVSTLRSAPPVFSLCPFQRQYMIHSHNHKIASQGNSRCPPQPLKRQTLPWQQVQWMQKLCTINFMEMSVTCDHIFRQLLAFKSRSERLKTQGWPTMAPSWRWVYRMFKARRKIIPSPNVFIGPFGPQRDLIGQSLKILHIMIYWVPLCNARGVSLESLRRGPWCLLQTP